MSITNFVEVFQCDDVVCFVFLYQWMCEKDDLMSTFVWYYNIRMGYHVRLLNVFIKFNNISDSQLLLNCDPFCV